jgi:hypothetical protein
MKKTIALLGFFLLASSTLIAQRLSLNENGSIPVWIVSGPYEQPHVGFGTPDDFDPIGEVDLVPTSEKGWFPQQINHDGFLDFNDLLGWDVNIGEPEKIWSARAAYATAVILSDLGGDARLYFSGNSRIKVILNNEMLYLSPTDENAIPDARFVDVTLNQGENRIIIRTTQSHQNHGIVIFEELRYDWGFFARIEPSVQNLVVEIPEILTARDKVGIRSTFFYKMIDERLMQRHDLLVETSSMGEKAHITLGSGENDVSFETDYLPFGRSRHEIWFPEIEDTTKLHITAEIGTQETTHSVDIHPAPKYSLHLAFLSHTDIGYTHTQPIVREIHMSILDDVVALCEEDPDFRWTIETVWMLDAYHNGRTPEQFQKLIDFVLKGRISVSPFYSNPFTGMVSEEEMIRSLDKADEFSQIYGITYNAAIYNDVPGQSWFLPQMLDAQGIGFLANGLNEVYGNYKLQQAIPKVMLWEGDNGSQVVHYRTESYNEAMAYGLERDNPAIEHRMWQRIMKLQADGYIFDHILLNSAFGDNLGIARRQWDAHKRWNDEYVWPRFVPATVSSFAETFLPLTVGRLPIVRGDAISDWDIYYQGEPHRMQRYRQTQHRLFAAENLAVVSALQYPAMNTLKKGLDRAYNLQLHYSGHGSGLEYGYGSDDENERAFYYREGYVAGASTESLETWERAAFRYTYPQAALDGEHAVVLNPHGHMVTGPVYLGLKPVWNERYGLIDKTTGMCVPSVIVDHVLHFLAVDVPALGWKKYQLVPECVYREPEQFGKVPNQIENDWFRITADPASGTIRSLFNKITGDEMLQKGQYFAGIMVQEGDPNEEFNNFDLPAGNIKIQEDYPIARHLIIEREGSLVPEIRIKLFYGLPQIEVRVNVDLRALKTTTIPQAFAAAFPRVSGEDGVFVETLGGFLDGQTDRLPSLSSTAFSMRRSAVSTNGSLTMNLASPDARVLFLDRHHLLSNLVNNFPDNWNRREPNDMILSTSYSFNVHEGDFESGRSARFSWEAAVPLVVNRGWFYNDPISYSAIKLNSEFTILQSLRPLGESVHDGILIRLRNTNPKQKEQVSIEAPWLLQGKIHKSDYFGGNRTQLNVENGRLKIGIEPNETVTLMWKNSKIN